MILQDRVPLVFQRRAILIIMSTIIHAYRVHPVQATKQAMIAVEKIQIAQQPFVE
jgi:hypothetical protein